MTPVKRHVRRPAGQSAARAPRRITSQAASGGQCEADGAQGLDNRALEPLLLQLHASTTIAQFWVALQRLLKEAVPHDALVAYLNFFDFASSWRAARILATPNAQRPTPWFESRRSVDMTPQFVLSRPQRIKVYRLSDVVPDPQELRNTSFFKDYLAPGGWDHLAVALFWRRRRVWSEFALRRTGEQGDFTAIELRVLSRLHPHIDTVLDRLIALEEERAQMQWLKEFNDHLPYALLFLNLELEPVYMNREAQENCAAWNFGPDKTRALQVREVFSVPEPISEACRSLKQRWLAQRTQSDTEEARFSFRLVHPLHPELTANITLRTDTPSETVKPGFVIHLSKELPADAVTSNLPVHSLLHRLTPAEREITRHVALGESNDEIAARLHKSVFTVKSHLTRIYEKLRVRGRSQLLVLLR